MERSARAAVPGIRQETQYTCMSTSLCAAMKAHGKDISEADVNRVVGARAMQGAAWEELLGAAQYFGMRGSLVVPATLKMLREWTARGVPVIIAWNPEGRPWSHASVVVDVDDGDNVHVMDPNIPDPSEHFRVVPKTEFYKSWMEPVGDKMVIRRPACAIEREITPDGRQVMASKKKKPRQPSHRLGPDFPEQVQRRPGAGAHQNRQRDVEKGHSRKPKYPKDPEREAAERVVARLGPLIYHTHNGWVVEPEADIARGDDTEILRLPDDATPEQVEQAVEKIYGRGVKIRSINPTWCEAGSCKHHQGPFLPSGKIVMAANSNREQYSEFYDELEGIAALGDGDGTYSLKAKDIQGQIREYADQIGFRGDKLPDWLLVLGRFEGIDAKKTHDEGMHRASWLGELESHVHAELVEAVGVIPQVEQSAWDMGWGGERLPKWLLGLGEIYKVDVKREYREGVKARKQDDRTASTHTRTSGGRAMARRITERYLGENDG